MAARITHKAAYVNALTVGKTGPEIDKSLRPEVAALWAEVTRLAGINAPVAPTPARKDRRRV